MDILILDLDSSARSIYGRCVYAKQPVKRKNLDDREVMLSTVTFTRSLPIVSYISERSDHLVT